MFNLRTITPQEAKINPEPTLEEYMLELVNYGFPGLSFMQGGWYCKVEMNTNTVGASFDIASDFKNPTPMDAVLQCRERIFNALKELSK